MKITKEFEIKNSSNIDDSHNEKRTKTCRSRFFREIAVRTSR